MHRKQYEDLATAIHYGIHNVERNLISDGLLAGMDALMARRVIALLVSGLTQWYTDNRHPFNPEAFLTACELLEAVEAVRPTPPKRQLYHLIAYDDVQPGDCLFYVTSGGHQRMGVVDRKTDRAVRVVKGWNFTLREAVADTSTLLRRAHWSRLHAELWSPEDFPGNAAK